MDLLYTESPSSLVPFPRPDSLRRALAQFQNLLADASGISRHTEAIYREIREIQSRLGTPAEHPADLDRVCERAHALNNARTSSTLFRAVLNDPVL